jgi:hypothetical protein
LFLPGTRVRPLEWKSGSRIGDALSLVQKSDAAPTSGSSTAARWCPAGGKTLRQAKKALKTKSKQVADKWLWREGLNGQGEKGGHVAI